MPAKLTNASILTIPVGKRVTDTAVQGFCANGIKGGVSFSYRYPSPTRPGHHREATIGTSQDGFTVEKARAIAKELAGLVARGLDPRDEQTRRQKAQEIEDQAPTVAEAFDAYKRDAAFKRLRTKDERRRFFENWILPELGTEKLKEVGRTAVSKILANIGRKSNSVHVAHKAARYLSAFFNWQVLQDENFRSPMVKGMDTYSPRDHARERTLSSIELRDLSEAVAATAEPYASIVRMLLLTALRRSEIAELRWREVHQHEGEKPYILIPKERMKANHPHTIPMTTDMITVLKRFAPEVGKPKPEHFVFSTTGGETPFSGFSKSKKRLDTEIGKVRKRRGEKENLTTWRHHDLRRTARILMSGEGVLADISERVLAHQMDVVRGTYDLHSYFDEKREALEKLATRLREIMSTGILPSPAAASKSIDDAKRTNVVPLMRKKRAK